MLNNEKKILLKVENLKKYFDVSEGWFSKDRKYLRAVDGVNFEVMEGETFGIVGESGCGKSTLGNIIMNLTEPTKGKITFDSTDILSMHGEKLRKIRAHMQMVFQDPFSSLNPRMRVSDIIAEPLKTHGKLKGSQLHDIVYDLMETVGLDKNYARRYPHEFSGGQRQRIGIARALALKPKLIICDEPVSALDVSIQAQILNLLSKLQKEFNLTYIFIAHGLPVVRHICDRIAVMYLGKILEISEKEELFANPLHPYTVGLLESVPISDPCMRENVNRKLLTGELPSPVNLPEGCRFRTRCQRAENICSRQEPVLKEVMPGHFTACHNIEI